MMAKYKVLIADYEPRSIKRTQELLVENFDCATEVAQNGIAAIDLFNQIKPDLIIIEAMIPKKHGFDVCLDIKNSPQGKKTPVIITTHVYKGVKYRNQAIHIYKCDDYIEKPCPDALILDTVKKFIPLTPKKPEEPVKSKTEAKPASRDEMKPLAMDHKPSMVPEDIEREIASRVDEVLTLFSGEESAAPARKKEKPGEVKISKIATGAKVTSAVQDKIEKETKLAAEKKREERIIIESIEESFPLKKSKPFPEPEVIYQPSAQEAAPPAETVPVEAHPEAPIKYRSMTFKMALIGISILVLVGILFVVFPLFKGKTSDEKGLKPSLKIDTQKKTTASVPSLPSRNTQPAVQNQATAGISQQSVPNPVPETPKSSVTTEQVQQNTVQKAIVQPPAPTPIPPRAEQKQAAPTPAPAARKSPPPTPTPSRTEQKPVAPTPARAEQKSPAPIPTAGRPDQTSPAKKAEQKPTQPESTASRTNLTPLQQATPPVKDSSAPQRTTPTVKEETVNNPVVQATEPPKAPQEVPKQEAPEISTINEGDLIEYSQLDKAPGYLAHENPKYPSAAKRKGIEGQVVLNVLIGTNGHVQNVKLVKGLDQSLDQMALDAAKLWIYRPPTKNGIRVTTWKTETVNFFSSSDN